MTYAKTARIPFMFILCFFLAQAGEISNQTCYAKATSDAVKPLVHKAKQPSAQSRKGQALFQENNCNVCHTVSGKGGCLAPPLDGIGSRRTRKFLLLRITSGSCTETEFSNQYGLAELMPHARVPSTTANAIVEYLLTLKAPKHGFKIIGHDENKGGTKEPQSSGGSPGGAIARGRQLISRKGCLSCHSFGNLGGTFAPKFNGIGVRVTEDAIRRQISGAQLLTLEDDPEYGARGTTMPPLDLTDKDIDDLTAFLSSLK